MRYSRSVILIAPKLLRCNRVHRQMDRLAKGQPREQQLRSAEEWQIDEHV
jgi:hypothetical protein